AQALRRRQRARPGVVPAGGLDAGARRAGGGARAGGAAGRARRAGGRRRRTGVPVQGLAPAPRRPGRHVSPAGGVERDPGPAGSGGSAAVGSGPAAVAHRSRPPAGAGPMRDALGSVQSVLVLGGASDIALATVRELVADRTRTVVLAARDPDGL